VVTNHQKMYKMRSRGTCSLYLPPFPPATFFPGVPCRCIFCRFKTGVKNRRLYHLLWIRTCMPLPDIGSSKPRLLQIRQMALRGQLLGYVRLFYYKAPIQFPHLVQSLPKSLLYLSKDRKFIRFFEAFINATCVSASLSNFF
jgi:hypothetical protein